MLYQVRDRLGVIDPARQPEGQVTTEDPASTEGGEPGQAQAAASTTGPDQQRHAVAADSGGIGQGMEDAYAHLLLMLLRPVNGPGCDGGSRCGQPGGGQAAGSRLIGGGEIHDARRQPCPGRPLDQQRMDWVPEPRSVQGVPEPAGPDEPGGPLPGPDELIEADGLLKTGDHGHDGSRFPRAGLLNRPA
jgi:hypothetical protein